MSGIDVGSALTMIDLQGNRVPLVVECVDVTVQIQGTAPEIPVLTAQQEARVMDIAARLMRPAQ